MLAGKKVDIATVMQRLAAAAREENLAFGERTMTYNSRLAQELGKWAKENGEEDAFHFAVYVAYFVDGKNIGDEDVLVELCEKIGLDPAAAQGVLTRHTFAAAVDADWEESRRSEIIIAPTFIAGERRLAGYQPFSALKRLVENAGARLKRPID